MKKLAVVLLVTVGYSLYSQKPPLVQKFKERGPIMMWVNLPQDTVGLLNAYNSTLNAYIPTQQDSYLTKAGKYKNLAITTAGITSGLVTVTYINLSDNTVQVKAQIIRARVISLIGGVISLYFNIKGNNALIKAGKVVS